MSETHDPKETGTGSDQPSELPTEHQKAADPDPQPPIPQTIVSEVMLTDDPAFSLDAGTPVASPAVPPLPAPGTLPSVAAWLQSAPKTEITEQSIPMTIVGEVVTPLETPAPVATAETPAPQPAPHVDLLEETPVEALPLEEAEPPAETELAPIELAKAHAIEPAPVAIGTEAVAEAEAGSVSASAVVPEAAAIDPVPLAAYAAVAATALPAHEGTTATEVFAHAHADVDARKGIFAAGPITKLAGISGFLACIAGLAIVIAGCSGLESLGGVSIFSFSVYILYASVGGLAVAFLGGLIEHRRMREETGVMGALFSNTIAAIGGGLLWLLWQGWKVL